MPWRRCCFWFGCSILQGMMGCWNMISITQTLHILFEFAEGWCDMMRWYVNLWFSSAMVHLYLLGIVCFLLHFPNRFQHIKTCVILPTRKLFIGRTSCEKTQDTLSKSSITPENRPSQKETDRLPTIIFQGTRWHVSFQGYSSIFCLRRVMCWSQTEASEAIFDISWSTEMCFFCLATNSLQQTPYLVVLCYPLYRTQT